MNQRAQELQLARQLFAAVERLLLVLLGLAGRALGILRRPAVGLVVVSPQPSRSDCATFDPAPEGVAEPLEIKGAVTLEHRQHKAAFVERQKDLGVVCVDGRCNVDRELDLASLMDSLGE